jgi:predicted nucleic acid-binding protein
LTLVIDASMALAWVFERQQGSDGERANRLLEACGTDTWWVPGLWYLEVTNALLVAERRKLISEAQSDLFLTRLSGLPIDTDADPLPGRTSAVLTLARSHGLSSYDACYLELAHRLGATLASFDRQLNQAAGDLGIALFA